MSELKNFPKVINGDTVIGFTSTKKIKDLQWMDMASLSSWYQDDPEKNHLGLVELFSSMADYRMPIYKNFFKNKEVLEVNGANGTFTYDLPVKKSTGCYTAGDTSDYAEAPGIDGTVFPIVLDEAFTPGDVLTYDAMYGEQVIVSEDHEVIKEGDTWRHMVTLVSNDGGAWFPADKLKTGIQYFKVGHGLGEFSEKFSAIQSPDRVGTLTNEFVLGNHRGVETFYTMYSGMKKFSGAAMHSREFWSKFMTEQESLGQDEDGKPLEMFYAAKMKGKNIDLRTVRVGATMEYLVLLELMKLEAHSLLFQKAAVINDVNGTKRLNEGIWHQIRRGRIIKYAKPGTITRNHIKEAAAYIFRNRKDLMPHQREIKFKCGYMAYLNMMQIFHTEVNSQVNNLTQFLGTDRSLPSSPISGKNLQSLELEPVMFTKVNIPEIGVVSIEHDPSLDYLPLTDRLEKDFVGDGFAWTSYSMCIWDAGDAEYSNALTNLPSGTTLIDGGSKRANIYYVKPEGENMWWGYQEGRYSPDKASGIMSSMKTMGREFWAHSISAGWVRDISRYITIELKR
jgi:hypothetical protein